MIACDANFGLLKQDIEFVEVPSHSTMFVWLNNEKAPFDDVAFRRALRMATNKERVMIEAYQGFSTVASS